MVSAGASSITGRGRSHGELQPDFQRRLCSRRDGTHIVSSRKPVKGRSSFLGLWNIKHSKEEPKIIPEECGSPCRRRDVSSLEKRGFVLLVLLLERIIEINGTTAEITVKVCLIMGRNGREDSSADVPGDAHLGLRPWIRSLTALHQG